MKWRGIMIGAAVATLLTSGNVLMAQDVVDLEARAKANNATDKANDVQGGLVEVEQRVTDVETVNVNQQMEINNNTQTLNNGALGDLTCIDGQVAQFDGTLGEWVCANLPAGGGGGIPFQVFDSESDPVGIITAMNYDRRGAVFVSVVLDLDSFGVTDPALVGKRVINQVRSGAVQVPGTAQSDFTGAFRHTQVLFTDDDCGQSGGSAYVFAEQGFPPAIAASGFVKGQNGDNQLYVAINRDTFFTGLANTATEVAVESFLDRGNNPLGQGISTIPGVCVDDDPSNWAFDGGYLVNEAVLAVSDVGATFPEPLSLDFTGQ